MSKAPNELGALWEKSGSKGPYMTGTINGVAVVVFKNDARVEGSQQPHWRVLKAERKPVAPRASDPVETLSGPIPDDEVIPF